VFFATLNKNREVAEWLKAHAWKACIWQHIEGSNPFLSAEKLMLPERGAFFVL
jgi:hypothetical protein